MFFTDALRCKVASLLRPCLENEPELELELELGLLRSTGCAKNLVFNPSILNPSIEESTGMEFKRVEVGELRVRISPWSSPSLIIEVRGINVTLTPRKAGDKRHVILSDLDAKKRKEVIASVDPEGASLHEIMERVSVRVSSGNRLLTSLVDAMVRCSQIRLHDIHLQLQCTESHACLLEVSDFSLEPQLLDQCCLFRGLVGSLIASGKQCMLSISCNSVEFGLKENDGVNFITSLTGLSTSIRLNNLQPLHYGIKLSHLDFKFSPITIPVLMMMSDLLSSKRFKGGRNGQELWKIAIKKIGNLTVTSRLSLHKVGNIVVLWSRYVRSYQSLLLLFGYSADKAIEDSVARLSSDSMLLSHLKHQWSVVHELEEHLPAEAVARARRIARQRALLYSGSMDLKLPTGFVTTSLLKILSPVLLLWKAISFIFHSIISSFFMWSILSLHQRTRSSSTLSLPSISSDYGSQLHFSLNLEELYITFHAIADHASINGKVQHGAKLPHFKFPSFCLNVRSLGLIYAVGGTSKTSFLACGELKLHLSSLRTSTMVSDQRVKRNTSIKGSGIESKVILWSDPALLYHPSERDNVGSLNPVESIPFLVLKNTIEDSWSNWKTIRAQSERMDVQLIEQPFVLCELKTFLVDPYLGRGDYGLWKCSFTLGKLNFDLDYLSILSATMLLKQMQDYRHWTTRIGRTENLAYSSSFFEESTEIKLQDRIHLYTSQMKVAMLNLIPDKNIQVGAFIAGPNIQISLQREQWFDASEQDSNPNASLGNSNFCFALDLENTEFVVWPTAKSILAALTGESSYDEAAAEYLWLKEPRTVDISNAHLNERFVSQGRVAVDVFLRFNGLIVFVVDLELNQQCHVTELMPVTIQSSTCRDYIHSLSSTEYVLSMSLNVVTTGVAVSIHVDRLWTFLQVFEGILSGASSVYVNFESATLGFSQDSIRELISSIEKGVENSTVESEAADGTMITISTQVLVDVSLQLEAADIILNDLRNFHDTRSSVKSYDTFCSSRRSLRSLPICMETTSPDFIDMSSFGIGVFIKKSRFQISGEEYHADMLIDLPEIQSNVFDCQSLAGVFTDLFQMKNMISQTSHRLYQFSLSKCIFSSHVDSRAYASSSASASNVVDGSIPDNCRTSYTVEGLRSNVEGSIAQPCCADLKFKRDKLLSPTTPLSTSLCWILAEVGIGEIIVAENTMKDLVIDAHHLNELKVSILVCEELDTINFNIQGGYMFLETTALAMFIYCFKVYFPLMMNCTLLAFNASDESPQKPENPMDSALTEAQSSNQSNNEGVRGTISPTSCSGIQKEFKWNAIKTLTVEVSQFSLILAVTDGSGGAQELVLEADMSLELINSGKKLLFDLNRLTVYTQHLHKSSSYETKDSSLPHFRSNLLGDLPSYVSSGNFTLRELHDAHSRSPQAFKSEILPEKGFSEFSRLYHGSYILKHVTVSIMIEKMAMGSQMHLVQWKSDWFGNGSISGLDLTIKLSEIQMLSALSAPLSGILGAKSSQSLKQSTLSRNHGWTSDSDYTVPDGAIVAIEDLHQHMYFAVEAVDKKFCIIGALHYSIVGKRSLFRVRYHKSWKSRVSWISFISLHARNEEGVPLRLNGSPGSGFVEISSSDDKGWALWQILPYKSDTHADDNEAESHGIYTRKAFHLMNQKNNCAIAFIDGLPEFVKKPGNPLKVKVFDEFSLINDIGRLDIPNMHSDKAYDTYVRESSHIEGEASRHDSNLPYVNITIDKLVLTILHEVSVANDAFPLIQGCISDICVIGQKLPSKFRVISSFNIAIHLFDAQRNLWREIISPVNSFLFYRSRFAHQDLVKVYRGVPVHFYFRMGQVDISLAEISLDVLLYLTGKLNIAGPYAVRSSTVFPNCCKLENHSGLNLLCHFADDQDVKIAGKQSATIFLRRVPFADKHRDSESLVSISLTEESHFSTSPINIVLPHAQVFAWRTRVISLYDSRSFPGPFIVVEVSKKTEDGLLLIVSPLLRIHNESGFSMELRFRRPQETEKESASVLLRNGDTIDDSMAVFDALDLSGGSKRALMSLTLGNFLLSIRPEIIEYIGKSGESVSMNWSEDLKGGKAVRVSGIFDKLNYTFRKAFGVESVKSFFSSLNCPLSIEGQHASDLYFLIQTIGRDVPVMQPPNMGDTSDSKNSPVAMQVQKEIFIYPTVQVHNLLQSEIHLLLTETHPDVCVTQDHRNIGKEAIIPCGSSAYFYANPSMIYFTVTLTAHSSKCKPVNSGDWVKKLHNQKNEVHYLDIVLDFGGGKYFASLRLSRDDRGILEATVFTTYTLQNNTELFLYCSSSKQKPFTWAESGNHSSNLPPELGCFLPPNSSRSWFLKSNKVHLKLVQDKISEALLDLDVLSGFTELCLETCDDLAVNHVAKVGVSLQPCMHKVCVPAQVICIVPRYSICNESEECIIVRQCYLEDDMGRFTSIAGKQKATLQVRNSIRKKQKTSFFDSILKNHRNVNEDSQIFVQFRPEEVGYSWSGPICVASLGRFFLKFKGPSASHANQSNSITWKEEKSIQFAAVHVSEESSSLVLHFYMPPNLAIPYRIENCLDGLSILYYQKESMESDILGSSASVEYVWDDLNLPHKLIVQIVDMHLLREINIDKMSAWKPFLKMRQNKGLLLHLPLDKGFGVEKRTDEPYGLEVLKVGYEVYADGLTRVLRICELANCYKEEKMLQPCANFQFRVSDFRMHLLENNKQDTDAEEVPIYSTIVIARLANITVDSLITDQYKYNCIRIQSLNVDEKWQGAPFASMIRRSQLHDSCLNENVLRVIFILHSTNSNVKQVKYSSIILQPIDLKVDEETLMRLVPFWRTSLNDSKTPSQQFYFKHFEIHPIKIIASFLPGSPYSSYSSAQESLRSLLHSVIKVPAINNTVVELNGVLLTHALLTFRELLIKCAKHYSWYVVRAVYKTKGSHLLPPAFASIFDDTASSSLDVFFDPSDGSVNLPGLTLGMFKVISKCIDSKGFSGTKRYFGDLGKSIKTASSNALFAAVTEISDSILRGAETSGFNGMVNGFHQGILRLAMEPYLLGAAVMKGGPDRKIKLDRSPGVDELYIEGYLQAMLDVMYKQEYLRVRVIDNEVILKNLPPNSSVINDIVENVKNFLVNKALLKGDSSTASRPLRHLRSENDWKIGPTVLTLCEHLFVSFAIRMLRKQTNKFLVGVKWRVKVEGREKVEVSSEESKEKPNRKWAIGKFVLSGMVAYLDGRLCRHIPNPIARRIVSGYLLSFLDKNDGE